MNTGQQSDCGLPDLFDWTPTPMGEPAGNPPEKLPHSSISRRFHEPLIDRKRHRAVQLVTTAQGRDIHGPRPRMTVLDNTKRPIDSQLPKSFRKW